MDREINRVNPPRRRNNRKEQPIKDFVVIIGFIMMFMCFGMLLEASVRAWNCPNEKKRAAVYCFGLLIFTALFLLYWYYRFGKSLLQRNSQDASQNVSSKDSNLWA